MARGGESFERRQRERAKKAKALAKRERRLQPSTDSEGEPGAPASVEEAVVLDQLVALHQAFENGSMKFDEFEARREELLAMLRVV